MVRIIRQKADGSWPAPPAETPRQYTLSEACRLRRAALDARGQAYHEAPLNAEIERLAQIAMAQHNMKL